MCMCVFDCKHVSKNPKVWKSMENSCISFDLDHLYRTKVKGVPLQEFLTHTQTLSFCALVSAAHLLVIKVG